MLFGKQADGEGMASSNLWLRNGGPKHKPDISLVNETGHLEKLTTQHCIPVLKSMGEMVCKSVETAAGSVLKR